MYKSIVCFCVAVVFFACMSVDTSESRPVVIEEFTATWCGFCYGAGLALDQIHEETSREEIVVIAYHINDAYDVKPFNSSRMEYYGVNGIPRVFFNGNRDRIGGSGETDGQSGVNKLYKTYLNLISLAKIDIERNDPFNLSLQGEITTKSITMKLTLHADTSYPHSLKAIFLTTRDGIRVNAPNGQSELNFVVDTYVGEEMFEVNEAGTIVFEKDKAVQLSASWLEDVQPVVIIQDTDRKQIVGAVGMFAAEQVSVEEWALH
ncbi:hypothetical protein GF373_05285 [bacterium]|nr:hypothetical protein [bacterium]